MFWHDVRLPSSCAPAYAEVASVKQRWENTRQEIQEQTNHTTHMLANELNGSLQCSRDGNTFEHHQLTQSRKQALQRTAESDRNEAGVLERGVGKLQSLQVLDILQESC